MFGVPGVRVLAAERDGGGLRLTVETNQQAEGCRGCGVLAMPHGRREHLLHDAPFGHRRVRAVWRKRVWRCLEPACAMVTFTEMHALAPPRALLTRRAVMWAADALSDDDIHRQRVGPPARRRLAHAVGRPQGRSPPPRRRPEPADGGGVPRRRRARLASGQVRARPRGHLHGRPHAGRDRAGIRARLLDLVLGRSGPAYAGWLDARQPEFRAQIKSAALDPFRGYANALRDSLPDAVQVLDAFHVVKLGTQVVDEVRRRVQQEQLGRRGHKHDPLYKIRGLLRHGLEHLTERQHTRLQAGLLAGDPHAEVELAWSCYQQVRAIYAGTASLRERRTMAEKVIASLPTCPIPEVARLGRTPRAWRSQVLAYFDTDGLSNGGTEAINMLIEKARRLAHGYRNFGNYRLRMLIAASGTRGRRVRTATV
jgi:transposase